MADDDILLFDSHRYIFLYNVENLEFYPFLNSLPFHVVQSSLKILKISEQNIAKRQNFKKQDL